LHRSAVELILHRPIAYLVFGQSEITQPNIEIFIHEHVVRFDVPVHYAVLVEVCDDADHLLHDGLSAILGEVGLLFVDYVEESALLDQLHGQAELRGFRYGADHEDDVGVAVLGEHVDLIVELFEKLLADVGVEDLFDGYVQVEVFAFVDGAEAAHRDLLAHLQICHFENEDAVEGLPLGLVLLGFYFGSGSDAGGCWSLILLEAEVPFSFSFRFEEVFFFLFFKGPEFSSLFFRIRYFCRGEAQLEGILKIIGKFKGEKRFKSFFEGIAF